MAKEKLTLEQKKASLRKRGYREATKQIPESEKTFKYKSLNTPKGSYKKKTVPLPERTIKMVKSDEPFAKRRAEESRKKNVARVKLTRAKNKQMKSDIRRWTKKLGHMPDEIEMNKERRREAAKKVNEQSGNKEVSSLKTKTITSSKNAPLTKSDGTANLRTQVLSSPKAKGKEKEVMAKFAKGDLKMGKSGKTVTSPRQAKAIALSEAQWEGYKRRAGAKSNAQADKMYDNKLEREKPKKKKKK